MRHEYGLASLSAGTPRIRGFAVEAPDCRAFISPQKSRAPHALVITCARVHCGSSCLITRASCPSEVRILHRPKRNAEATREPGCDFANTLAAALFYSSRDGSHSRAV